MPVDQCKGQCHKVEISMQNFRSSSIFNNVGVGQ